MSLDNIVVNLKQKLQKKNDNNMDAPKDLCFPLQSSGWDSK